MLAFLFHLVPSIIWGAENSLGSSRNHQLMGVVWFGGWPCWWVFLQLLRPWGLLVRDSNVKVHIPLASWDEARAVAEWWGEGKIGPPPPPAPTIDAWLVVGLSALLALLANALYTGAEVVACMDRGCCKDDASTLASCRATGYPNSTAS